ncbi:MAG: T9SS type A sorting domain-containing protein, partial [Saprospiraceae bacterium]|nr:T9SS type A sorting domain-containing protein [Saprospiraceae bacterium]
TCVASPNVTVSCEAFDPTFQAYGGIASQSCSVDSVTTTVSYSLFDTLCSRGTITRLFNVYNGAGQSGQCTQKIVSNYNQDYFIRFPNDVIVTSCDTTGVYGTPVFFGEDCEQFSITYTDEIFDVVPDACYKIDRTWTIYNECTYDPLLPRIIVPNPNPVAQSNHPDNLLGPTVSPIQTPGDPWKTTQSKINPTDQFPTNFAIFYDPAANGYQYKQIIKVIDNEDPVIENCYGQAGQIVDDVSNNNNQLWNAQYWFDPLHISSDLCEGAADIGIVATDACSREQLSVEFQLLLDLNGDNVRETVINSTQLPPSNTVYFNNVSGNSETRQFDFRPVPANQKWRFAKQEIISGNRRMVNIRFNSESQPANYVPVQLPYGNHKIKWFVKDACLNESVCEYNIIIRDVKAPTVLCQSGVNVNMLVFQQAPLSTLDLLQYQEDNCTPSQFLVEGLRKSGTGFGFPLDNSGNPVTTIEFGCDELGPQMVELWSRDRYGNSGVCLTTVNIVDNSDNCSIDQSVDVSGKITTELNDGIVDVAINIESGIGQFTPPFSLLPGNHTDTLGNYTISGSVPIASSFTIRPFNDDFPLNGLTTFDLVLISKHILGIEALGSPLKLIAADANRSNSITTSDIVELRKLILGIYNFLPNNDSWRFIPKSYTFPNPLNPFAPPFPDSIRVVELLSDMTNGNFWGVKIGDVNNTVESNATAQPDDRQAKPVYFDLLSDHAEKVQSGDIIDLRLQAAEALQGCQFTLDFNGLELLEIVPAEHVGQEHFARFPEKNSITFAWEKGGTPAFGFKVRAREAGELHQKLSISSNITKAEAYPSKNPSVIGWPIIRGREMQGFELYQNQPNPFFGSTEIRFNLPEASEATLEVTDMSGRVIYTHTGYYQQGMHLLKLEKDAVDVRGVLYYRLQTPTYSAQRKMVRL